MNILFEIRKELKRNIDLKYKKGSINFFNEPIKLYGVRTPYVRKIAKKYFDKNLEKNKIFKLCEQLLKSDYYEEAIIAFSWANRLNYEKKDFKIFESWLKKYVNNWAKCDDFCTHTFGSLLLKFPEFLFKLNIWAKSKNRWERRASAVILIHLIVRKNYLKKIFEISDILLLDKDDLVQKAYGWALKVASDKYQKQVFDYVIKNKKIMPRTALRYAIEKMPQNMRQKAML
ncbi:DNA alkylation repair protein [Patescibacteria group bacterium]|nr:DNA alkylation repair protein [Patescibacteria group bacterium]MBU3923019.1 DNA alkylation repair protein [Patescibacteria group bacterium]